MGKHSTNEKDPRVTSTGPLGNHSTAFDSTDTNPAQLELNLYPAKRKHSVKSTATAAQYSRTVTMLETGPKNTMEFRRAGIMSPASRIKEMNDRMGYYISSNPINVWDEWGYCHKGVALYELIDSPKKGGVAQ